MSSTVNMAFARRPPLGLSTRLLLSPTTSTPSLHLVALRQFSTSRRTLQAQPVHDSVNHVSSPRLGSGVYSTKEEPDKYVNPYAGGPSALEKAAHIFFFTEIVRGRCQLPNIIFVVSELVSPLRLPRNVAGLGTVLPPPIHNHVSF